MSNNAQPAILVDRPPVGRTLLFRIAPQSDVPAALQRLRKGLSPDCGVAGIGEPLVLALQKSIDGLRTFPAMSGAACHRRKEALCFVMHRVKVVKEGAGRRHPARGRREAVSGGRSSR